jgi:tetratricopeptide (TPR) repeat protein
MGIIFYLGIGIYSIINFRKKSVIVFGILFYLITLAPVSNIFFLGGSTMAERFMYMPSLGFCLVLTYFLMKFTKTESIKWSYKNLAEFFSVNRALFLIVIGITVLYSVKTFSRNKDWKDDMTIFSHDVRISKNSATAHYIFGRTLAASALKSANNKNQEDTLRLARKYFKEALEICHDYRTATSYLSYIYLYQNNVDSAYFYLKEGLKTAPDDVELNYYFGTALLKLGKFDESIKALNHALSLNPKYEDAYFKLAASYLNKGDVNNGLSCYLKVIEINPGRAEAYYSAAKLLEAKGDTLKAKEYFDKAASLGYNIK